MRSTYSALGCHVKPKHHLGLACNQHLLPLGQTFHAVERFLGCEIFENRVGELLRPFALLSIKVSKYLRRHQRGLGFR